MVTPETSKIGETELKTGEMAAICAAIEKLNHRLDKIEQNSFSHQSNHPSLDKFSVAESIADGIFAGINKEKACQFEPDKPCDHCSMCSARGF